MTSRKNLLREMLLLSPVYVCTALAGCSGTWSVYGVHYLLQPGHKPSATLQQCGHILSIIEIGKILSAIPGGILMEKIGRKPILILIGCVNLLSWLFLTTFPSINIIYVARFLHGIAAGLTQVVAFPMIGEISSPQHRGMLSNLFTASWGIGQLAFSIINSARQSYQFMQISGTFLSLLFILTIYWLIEPPENLIHKRKYKKARKNLKILRPYYSDARLNAEFVLMQQSVDPRATAGHRNWWRLLKTRSTQKCIVYVCLMNAATLLCGTTVIGPYLMEILPEIDYVSVTMYPLISNVLEIVMSIIFSTVIEEFPRRVLYVSASSFAAFNLALATASSYMISRHPAERWKWIFLIVNFVFLRAMGLVAVLNNTLRSEIFPAGIKGFANALCIIVRGISIASAAEMYTWFHTFSHLYVQYLVFVAVAAGLTIAAYASLPETGGKTLAEIQTELETGKPKNTSKFQRRRM